MMLWLSVCKSFHVSIFLSCKAMGGAWYMRDINGSLGTRLGVWYRDYIKGRHDYIVCLQLSMQNSVKSDTIG